MEVLNHLLEKGFTILRTLGEPRASGKIFDIKGDAFRDWGWFLKILPMSLGNFILSATSELYNKAKLVSSLKDTKRSKYLERFFVTFGDDFSVKFLSI